MLATVRRQAKRELASLILAEPSIRRSLTCIGKRQWTAQQHLNEVVIASINAQLDALLGWAADELGITRDDAYKAVVRQIAEQVLTELVLVYLDELLDSQRWTSVLGIGRDEVAQAVFADFEHLRSAHSAPGRCVWHGCVMVMCALRRGSQQRSLSVGDCY